MSLVYLHILYVFCKNSRTYISIYTRASFTSTIGDHSAHSFHPVDMRTTYGDAGLHSRTIFCFMTKKETPLRCSYRLFTFVSVYEAKQLTKLIKMTSNFACVGVCVCVCVFTIDS